jgi:ABC-type Fe3+-hydroxamate transport system substrate-binding protein
MVSPDPSASSSTRTLSIDLAVIAIDGVSPADGEEFTLPNVTARVVSIEGDKAQVEVVAIDGTPVAPASTAEPTDDDVMLAARKADEMPA